VTGNSSIGGGIVGLASAKSGKISDCACCFGKEAKVGRRQTANNSGVLHSGLYYKPSSVKARMAVQASARWWRFVMKIRALRNMRETHCRR
jgi:L-2-hydroxyglutarate oxidase